MPSNVQHCSSVLNPIYLLISSPSFLAVLVSAGDPHLASSNRRMIRDLRPSEVAVTSDSLGDPYFAEDTHGVTNVTAQLGLTTYLHCKVNNLNGKTVSNVIYSDKSTFINDSWDFLRTKK